MKWLWSVIREEPFVFVVGVAALIHSTWTLGTVFGGIEPDIKTDVLAWIGWVIPAFLIAIALDVGQISTSRKIRREGGTRMRFLTFFVFAAGTYYLQWLYIFNHLPSIAAGPGISADSMGFSVWLRNAVQWIGPALMPAGTLLYTFMDGEQRIIEAVVEEVKEVETQALAIIQPGFTVKCPHCGWTRPYKDAITAHRAMETHLKSCDGLRIEIPANQDSEVQK